MIWRILAVIKRLGFLCEANAKAFVESSFVKDLCLLPKQNLISHPLKQASLQTDFGVGWIRKI